MTAHIVDAVLPAIEVVPVDTELHATALAAFRGATGSCDRQLAAQVLERALLPPSARLQLVGHHGGGGEHELIGLRADLEDAFEDEAPTIELVLEPSAIDASLVVERPSGAHEEAESDEAHRGA